MKKTFTLIKQEFESSSMKTPQYLAFHRTFKSEFTKFVKSIGASSVEFSKPNHFDITGFFTVNGQMWYFSIGDLRWNKRQMLIRTAQHNKDWTGGSNQYASLESLESFTKDLKYVLKIAETW